MQTKELKTELLIYDVPDHDRHKDKILDYDTQTINGTHGEEYILFYDYTFINKLIQFIYT